MWNVASGVGVLPLVLVGPMLRRVERGSVTVFVALKAPRKVTLRVFTQAGTPPLLEGTRSTVRLSEHLHVVAVTATVATGGRQLDSGGLYCYQLHFGAPGTDSVPVPNSDTGEHLFTAGVVDASVDKARELLVYPGSHAPLPSFATPAAVPGNLRLLHGSCRKPHGEALDMLPVVDELNKAAPANASQRPQQLLLTGDQIYADDVADALLLIIQDVTRGLGLPAEVLPGQQAGSTLGKGWMAIGHRQSTVLGPAQLSSDHGPSHLFSFAEFVGMYLMVWSDVLWPEMLPAVRRVHPEEEHTFNTFGYPLASQQKKVLDKYAAESAALVGFRAGLVRVRRALANTPTLMIFDDHEVTDDWNVTREWCEKALFAPTASAPDRGSALGRRIAQNGLAAYCLFQAWGNTPERFAPAGDAGEPGRALLAAVSAWTGTEDDVSREIARRVGMPTGFVNGTPQRPVGALTYHYALSWPNYQLVVLDTRTWREFGVGPKDPPGLVYSDASLAAMLNGVSPLEPEGVAVVISPAPVIGLPVVEEVIQPLSRFVTADAVFGDHEAWLFHKAAFHKFLARLMTRTPVGTDNVRRSRVVVLGGDVHYGLSARLRYSAQRPYLSGTTLTEGVIAQFVGSSLHNQADLTRGLHGRGYAQARDILPRKHSVFWANPSGGRRWVGTHKTSGDSLFISGQFAEKEHNANFDFGEQQPDWRWDLGFIMHNEADPVLPPRPGTPQPVLAPTSTDRRAALAQYLAAAKNHDAYLGKWGDGKEIVGMNNLAELAFNWGAGESKSVSQTLWWRLEGETVAAPLTRYVVDMGLGPSLYPPTAPAPLAPETKTLEAPRLVVTEDKSSTGEAS